MEKMATVKSLNPLVAIKCTAYNQERYIRDALDGFVMQQTNFQFVAIVHDDASTDGTADIIREYAEKYPDVIKPIFETENQYSKKDGSLTRIMHETIAATGAKYIAYCEGDDYWTDPLKLQKQVDYMEAHQECSMCFTNAKIIDGTSDKEYGLSNSYPNDCDIPMEDLVLLGGGLCTTATMLCRREKHEQFRLKTQGVYVGDYCIQIMMGHVGRVHYLKDVTSAYRYMAIGSWTSRNGVASYSKRVSEIWPKHERFFQILDNATDFKYTQLFKYAMADFMFEDCKRYGHYAKAFLLWFKLYKPFERIGYRTFLEICGYGWLKRKAKIILGKPVLR